MVLQSTVGKPARMIGENPYDQRKSVWMDGSVVLIPGSIIHYALAEHDNVFFVLDKNGTEFPVEATGIKEIKHFSEGLGLIEVKGELWGFVGGNGKIVIEPQFKAAGFMSVTLIQAEECLVR